MLNDEIELKKGLSLDVVKAEFERCSGTQFDPEIAKVFLSILENHYDEIEEIKEKFKT